MDILIIVIHMFLSFFSSAYDGSKFFAVSETKQSCGFKRVAKHKSELSLKVTFMRLCDTKKLKKVHFPIFEVAESQQKCGLDDNHNDNLTFIGIFYYLTIDA